MDLQQIADSFEPMTCIMSVQVYEDGSYGNIRIVCGNKAYVDSIENPENISFAGMLNNKFIPDSPYQKYIPHDLNFEDACYRCAVLKKPFHTYIHPERYDFWVDMYMMPLAADNGDTYYFAYSQELTSAASSSRMSNVDAEVANEVLETCIKLRGTKDFKHTMDEVIGDISKMCEADKVCLILTDSQNRTFSVLSEAAGSPEADYSVEGYLHRAYEDFYSIIETWEECTPLISLHLSVYHIATTCQSLFLTGKVDGDSIGSRFEHLTWYDNLIIQNLYVSLFSFTFVGFKNHHITRGTLKIKHHILLRSDIECNSCLSSNLLRWVLWNIKRKLVQYTTDIALTVVRLGIYTKHNKA